MSDRAFLIAALENDSVSAAVIYALLQNPVLDCALLEQAARNVAAAPPNPAYQNVARIEQLRPTLCAKGSRK
jgi:hypothetical protein